MIKMERKQETACSLPYIADIGDILRIDYTQPKRILIAGSDSYIGKSFACFMKRWPDICQTDILSMKDDSWKTFDFTGYDAVLYADRSDCKAVYETDACQAVQAADKAKRAGAGMFIYLSSLHIYSRKAGMITRKTPVSPSGAYGKTKVIAEKELWKRNDDMFCVVVLRLPEVYGYGCKGSYHKLSRAAVRYKFFPEYNKKCSRIHINNLSSAVRGIIYYGKPGVYFPQDTACVSAYEIARVIAAFYGKKLRSTKLFNPVIWLLSHGIRTGYSIFGDFVCEQSLNVPEEWREVKGIKESVLLSESGWQLE